MMYLNIETVEADRLEVQVQNPNSLRHKSWYVRHTAVFLLRKSSFEPNLAVGGSRRIRDRNAI